MASLLNGFPSVSGITVSSLITGALTILETAIWNLLSGGNKWGIYILNVLTFEVDSVLSVEHRASARVPTYRMMSGAFASYNKISMPVDHRITLAVGGSKTRRTAFLLWLEAQRGSTTVFNVVTPEKTFTNVTLVNYSIRRTAETGTASRIIAECDFQEIRNTSGSFLYGLLSGILSADTSNASSASALPTSELGFVQTVTYAAKGVTDSVTAYISG